MADPTPTPEPLTQAEPVAILDIVKGVIAILGLVGVTVPDETAVKVGAGIVALVFFIQTTLATRRRVTPVARADAAVVAAKAEGKAEVIEAIAGPPPPPATFTIAPIDPATTTGALAALREISAQIQAGGPIADVTSTFTEREADELTAPLTGGLVDGSAYLIGEQPPAYVLPLRPGDELGASVQLPGPVDPETTDEILAAKFGPIR